MNDAAAAQRFEDRHFTVRDGLRLHYRDYPGDPGKPPILCLPGLTRNSRDFADFAERYSPRFRVLTLDFRGRGMSDYDPVPARSASICRRRSGGSRFGMPSSIG